MKKFLVAFSLAVVAMTSMTSCHGVRPGADEEAVLIDVLLFASTNDKG